MLIEENYFGLFRKVGEIEKNDWIWEVEVGQAKEEGGFLEKSFWDKEECGVW